MPPSSHSVHSAKEMQLRHKGNIYTQECNAPRHTAMVHGCCRAKLLTSEVRRLSLSRGSFFLGKDSPRTWSKTESSTKAQLCSTAPPKHAPFPALLQILTRIGSLSTLNFFFLATWGKGHASKIHK